MGSSLIVVSVVRWLLYQQQIAIYQNQYQQLLISAVDIYFINADISRYLIHQYWYQQQMHGQFTNSGISGKMTTLSAADSYLSKPISTATDISSTSTATSSMPILAVLQQLIHQCRYRQYFNSYFINADISST